MNTLLLLVAKSTTSNQFLWVKTSQTIGNTISTADKTAWFLVNNPFVSKLLSVLLAIVVAWFLIRLSRIIANFISSKIKRGFNDKDPDSVNKIAQLSGDLIFYAMATFSVYLWFKIVWIDIWLIVWWLSIGIWFATKEIISNLIAGIFIFSTKDYKIGDIIEIQDKQMPWWGIFGRLMRLPLDILSSKHLTFVELSYPIFNLCKVRWKHTPRRISLGWTSRLLFLWAPTLIKLSKCSKMNLILWISLPTKSWPTYWLTDMMIKK